MTKVVRLLAMCLSIAAALGHRIRGDSAGDHHSAGNWSVGQTVRTSSGPVSGHAAPVAKNVSEYLGIRYAPPPVRFRPSEPFLGAAIINGTDFGPACIGTNFASGPPGGETFPPNITPAGQALLLSLGASAPQDEDCLFLNVWTKPQVGQEKKPVLVSSRPFSPPPPHAQDLHDGS